MEQVQHLCCPPLSLMREGGTPMFAGETRLADLFHLGEQRHPLYETIAAHLVQRGKMQVTNPCMPHPSFFFPAHCQADRLCDVNVKHIEPARIAIDLGKQTSIFITHAHHAILHQHLVAPLVQLTDRDDVRGQARQVVDVVEGAVLPRLAGEQ
jgi:hypothetical protein